MMIRVMKAEGLENRISELRNNSVSIEGQDINEVLFSMLIKFSQGASLKADYWRIIKNGRHYFSSFDHRQQYGLLAPIDALEKAKEELEGRIISDARFERETGDLVFEFTGSLKLQVLNFTGYEVWEINFPNGSREHSNYAREYD